MASLIAPLASGINGCASGTAEIYQRGTTSSAVAYSYDSSRDALTQVTTHPLDANGGVSRYVTDPVDVVCKDSSGNILRTFTWEDRADMVEVRNAGFTGTLSTGGMGAGGRTDLDSVLSSFYSSLGGLDGKVLIGGLGQNIRDVLANTSSIVTNVTSTAYGGGAKGNGTTDDGGAIQAAVNAAVAAGGGIVYFPPGTYKIATPVSIGSPTKLWFMGVGPGSVTLACATSSGSMLTNATPQFVSNITFAESASNPSNFFQNITGTTFLNCTFTVTTVLAPITAGAGVSGFVGCTFTNTAASSVTLTLSGAATVYMTNCSVTQTAATASSFSISNASAYIQMTGGSIFMPTLNSTFLVAGTLGGVSLTGVQISHAAASGTSQLIANAAGITAVFSGCWITTGGAVLNMAAPVGTSALLYDVGNAIPGYPQVYPGVGAQISAARELGSGGLRTSTSATTYAPDATKYQFHDVTSSGASFQFTAPTVGFGQKTLLILRYKNTNAGAITPTFAAQYKIGTAPSVATNQAAVWLFVWDTVNTVMLQVGGNPVAYAA